MSDVHFREARLSDLPAIIDLLAEDPLGATREKPGSPPAACYTTAFKTIEADPHQFFIVAQMAETVVGCLQLTLIPGLSRCGMWRGQIESVRIAQDLRGNGIGRQLFEWAIEKCRAHGCALVQLTTDTARPDALRFYERLGFTHSHNGLKMALTIPTENSP